MESLVYEMQLKRLCLPCDTDFDDLRSGIIKNNICECNGMSQHIACVIKEKGKCLICSFIRN